ncbi:MAG: MFS transporter [Sporolactobacillus sp.]
MSFIGMIIGGKLFDRYGARPVIFTGMGIYSVGMFLMSSTTHANTNIYQMLGYFMILGLCQGLTTMQIGTHVLKLAPEHLISRVTSMTNSGQ